MQTREKIKRQYTAAKPPQPVNRVAVLLLLCQRVDIFLTFSRFSLVLPQLRNLNVLDLRHISELNNETVMEVVRKCRNLSSLNLCLNWSINDRFVNKCGGFTTQASAAAIPMQPTQRLKGFRKRWRSQRSFAAKCPDFDLICLSCHISSLEIKNIYISQLIFMNWMIDRALSLCSDHSKRSILHFSHIHTLMAEAAMLGANQPSGPIQG